MSRKEIEGRGLGGIMSHIPLIGSLLKGKFGSGAGKGLRLPGTMGLGKKGVWTDQLAEELHKPVKRQFPTRLVRVGGVDDTWSADFVDMQSFSKYNDRVKYLFNIIDVFSEYAWSIPLSDKTGKAIVKLWIRLDPQNPGTCG